MGGEAGVGEAGGAGGRPLALLSFDVEPFDIPTEYGVEIAVEKQFEIGREGLRRAVALLERRGAVATFFVTADYAERFRADVRALAEGGHEVASHGLTHGELMPGDLERSRLILQDVAGVPVVGFRRARMAPTDPAAVAGAGYAYDASENPIWMPGRYNRFFAPRRGRVVRTAAGAVAVIPASATPLVRVPLFWLALKNLPVWMVKGASSWVMRADGQVNTYVHPWELCGIQGYGLPWVVRRVDGEAMAARLGAYIEWLQGRAEMATYGRFAARLLAGADAAARRSTDDQASTSAGGRSDGRGGAGAGGVRARGRG